MLKTLALTLLALAGSVVLTLSGIGSPVAALHLAFAVGVVPLIFAAMIHFVPVLTRTGDPLAAIRRLPYLAQASGLVVFLALQGALPYGFMHAAATVDLLLAGFLLSWIFERSRAALGAPHPGWRWYGAALACLMLALLSVISMPLWPLQHQAMRLFHLHMNTLGLLGLAALGTLPVLMPTALGQADPQAANWLRRQLWLVAGGAVMVAVGCPLAWPMALPGGALLMVAIISLLGQWYRRFGRRCLLGDGVSVSLLAALVGLSVAIIGGAFHASGVMPARPTLFAWTAGFLLPLVTGAVSQLLPVWRWPGPQIPARAIMRAKLASGGHWRAAAFLSGALAILLGWPSLGGLLVVLGMARFAFDLLQAVRVTRSTR